MNSVLNNKDILTFDFFLYKAVRLSDKRTNEIGEQKLSTQASLNAPSPRISSLAITLGPRASLFFFSRLAQLDVATAAGSRRKDSPHTETRAQTHVKHAAIYVYM